jgi:hypothetical protein
MTVADPKGRLWRYRLTVGLVLATACSSPDSTVAPRDPAEFRGVPTTTAIGGLTLSLEPYLWRDFQPSSPPNGKPLVAVVRLHAVDGTAIPTSVRVAGLWIVNGGDVWTASPREQQLRIPGASTFEVVARDGPKWGPGIDVDVVVGVRDGAGAMSLLRAPAQRINRTD